MHGEPFGTATVDEFKPNFFQTLLRSSNFVPHAGGGGGGGDGGEGGIFGAQNAAFRHLKVYMY